MENKSRKLQVNEEVPQMRSVLLGQPRLEPPLSFPPPLPQQKTPSSGRSSSKASSADRLGITSPEMEMDPWKIEHLVPIPEMYRLERTHVYISGISPRQVARRIAASLQRESIVAEYNVEKASAKAETQDRILFCIQLFSDCGKIVVETQRRQGCGFAYYQTAKLILIAAKGISGGKRAPPKFKIPSCCPQTSDADQRECLVDSIAASSSMLSRTQYDSRQLALESLASITSRGTASSRAFVAKEVLLGILFKAISALIQQTAADSGVVDAGDELDHRHFVILRRLSVTIFANCLDALEKSGELTSVLKGNEMTLLHEGFFQSLVHLLNKSTDFPHEACQAARCFHILMRSSESVKKRVARDEILNLAKSACNFGSNAHCMLANESKMLLLEAGDFR